MTIEEYGAFRIHLLFLREEFGRFSGLLRRGGFGGIVCLDRLLWLRVVMFFASSAMGGEWRFTWKGMTLAGGSEDDQCTTNREREPSHKRRGG